jgi:type VI secretion system protein ImpK
MNDTSQLARGAGHTGDSVASLGGLLQQALLSKAAELARKGRHAEAAQLLADALTDRGEAAVAVLELLARIYAQQGKFAEAERLWTQVLTLNPSHEVSRRGLDRIARIHRRRSRPLIVAFFAGVVLASTLAGTSWLLVRSGKGLHDLQTSAQEAKAAMARLVAAQQDHTRRVQQLEAITKTIAAEQRRSAARLSALGTTLSELSAMQEATMRQLGPRASMAVSGQANKPSDSGPNLMLHVPGVSVQTKHVETLLVFEEGLFPRGAELSTEAKKRLRRLAHELEPYVGLIVVRIVGHTDNQPPLSARRYPDDIALGLRRAVVVEEYMRRESHLPPSMFAVATQGKDGAPFPNDTRENRSRNRTVVLHVTALSTMGTGTP